MLYGWIDPHYLETHAFGAASDEERERPELTTLTSLSTKGTYQHFIWVMVHPSHH
ncbi:MULTISPECIES: hypothetical protein [Pseudanabaena]|uniref:hypothetical protein n=1 Tax=Pseudanabaena TaxID=1152 RepID=UPI0024798FAA|nr:MULTISPECIES: hypothetical protein [Pseudanabaena]MEA5490076.1 hypothetical protein [Pseudanabaena sp. CCNP1317]WGS73390.1 hypothetical protein OA858_05000 [Pseudanabaena galeata CCNP1313]